MSAARLGRPPHTRPLWALNVESSSFWEVIKRSTGKKNRKSGRFVVFEVGFEPQTFRPTAGDSSTEPRQHLDTGLVWKRV